MAPTRVRMGVPVRHAVVAGALVLAAGTWMRPAELRALLEVPTGLVLPGAALLLSFGWRFDEAPRAVSLAAATILSCAFYPLLGLTLYGLSIQFSTRSFTIATAVVVAGAVAVDWIRRPRASRRAEPDPSSSVAARASEGAGGGRWAAWFGAVVVGMALVVLAGIELLPGAPGASYTQLSLGGAWARTTGPVAVGPGPFEAPITVHNAASSLRTYVVSATVDGTPTGRSERIEVTGGGTWRGSVSVGAAGNGCLRHLVVSVASAAATAPTASVDTWLTSRTGGPCPL